MSKKTEEACIQRFLNCYNEQYKRHYVHQRAEAYFPDLVGRSNWDFVAYEHDNPEKWIGIEIKEISTFREVDEWFKFWNGFSSDLTKDLEAKGIQGKFSIVGVPVVHPTLRERKKLLKTFIEVLVNKESTLKPDAFTDIGPDIANKFPNWPREKIRNHAEYEMYHGEFRPCELRIYKSPHSECEVTASGPFVARDAGEQHEETFNKAGIKHANKQLKLAKEKGAIKTILLFDCMPFIYPDLIKNELQNTDLKHISNIDLIYLVGTVSGEDRIDQIYSNR